MKTKLVLAILGTVLTLSASSASELGFLRPLFTEADRVSNPDLVGSWTVGDRDTDAVVIRDLGDGEYAFDLNVFGPLCLKAHLVRLGQFRFLDLTLMDPEVQVGSYTLLPAPYVTRAGDVFLVRHPAKDLRVEILASRLLCRIRLTGDELHLACAENGDWIAEAVGRREITVAKGHDLVTSSTQKLRQFILKHAEEDRIFSDVWKLRRRKAATPEAGPKTN